MKTNQKLKVLGMLVAGALMAGSGVRAAQLPVLQGKFTLASETRWGQAKLPAGDYSFTLDHAYAGGVITVLRGSQTVARIQTVGMNDFQSGRSEIVMEGGVVREVRLPQIGMSLHYGSAKSGQRSAPHEPALAQVIPITSARAGR